MWFVALSVSSFCFTKTRLRRCQVSRGRRPAIKLSRKALSAFLGLLRSWQTEHTFGMQMAKLLDLWHRLNLARANLAISFLNSASRSWPHLSMLPVRTDVFPSGKHAKKKESRKKKQEKKEKEEEITICLEQTVNFGPKKLMTSESLSASFSFEPIHGACTL